MAVTVIPSYLIDVFLIRSKRVKPSVHRSILISITCNFCSAVLVVGSIQRHIGQLAAQ